MSTFCYNEAENRQEKTVCELQMGKTGGNKMAESVLDQFKEVFKENKIDASKKVRIGIIGTGWIADAHMISWKARRKPL